jgi:hypothetical protein
MNYRKKGYTTIEETFSKNTIKFIYFDHLSKRVAKRIILFFIPKLTVVLVLVLVFILFIIIQHP